MKTRDIDYLGCSDRVHKANPIINQEVLKTYYHYMTERHNVYKKKEKGMPFPWTDDKILQENSFTCCKRYLDRTSKYLIKHISNNDTLLFSEKFWRTVLFRIYNKVETMDLINISSPSFWDDLTENMDKLDAYPNDPYSRAYKIIAIKYAYREESPKNPEWKSSMLYGLYKLRESYNGEIPAKVLTGAQCCIEWLKDNIKGAGDFITYQIWVDLTYIKEFPMSDNYYTIAGPGCQAGIDFLCEDKDGLTYEEFLFWLRDHIESIFKEFDPEYSSDKLFEDLPVSERYWSLQDLENSFCELSKYIYISEGRHKRPRKYINSTTGS